MPRSSPRRRAAGALLVAAALAFAGTAHAGPTEKQHRTIQLTEATAEPQPTFVDTGQPGPSVGDVVVVRDGLLANGEPAGTLNQVCTLVNLAGGPLSSDFECTGSIALHDGTITLQGPFVPAKAEQTAAITGGTGAYAKARGQVVIRAEDDVFVVELA